MATTGLDMISTRACRCSSLPAIPSGIRGAVIEGLKSRHARLEQPLPIRIGAHRLLCRLEAFVPLTVEPGDAGSEGPLQRANRIGGGPSSGRAVGRGRLCPLRPGRRPLSLQDEAASRP